MKLTTILLSVIFVSLACRGGKSSDSELSGRSNSGGLLKLEKIYEVLVKQDPCLQKARDINFLTYKFRDYSFASFLVEKLRGTSAQLPCELIEIVPSERRSLIQDIEEVAGGSFRVLAADISCEQALPSK